MSLFVDQWMEDKLSKRKFSFLTKDKSIHIKNMVIPDFCSDATEQWLYKTPPHLPSTQERMSLFSKLAVPYCIEVAKEALSKAQLTPNDITHIISVSCTGLLAPGLETLVAQKLGLNSHIERNAINFLGCYAAFHALRLAKHISDNDKGAHILIISAELCSLHFRNDPSDDNLLSTYLFSDGIAACIVSKDTQKVTKSLEILETSSSLISDGHRDMGWYIGNTGFEMVLNKNIPKHIYQNMNEAFQFILNKAGLKKDDIKHFAIHPGGKSILKAFEDSLNIDQKDLAVSYDILARYGNMSSATILYVLDSFLENKPNKKEGELVYSAAFGPGLSVESALLKYVSHG